jgi:hypothetical protein
VSVAHKGFFPQVLGNVAVLEQVVHMVQVAFCPKNLVGYAESFVPESPRSLDVLLFNVGWKILQQGFSDVGAIVNHDNFHGQSTVFG